MNIASTNPRIRALIVVLSCALATFLSYFGVRNAIATYYLNLDTRAGYERAAALDPPHARNWFLLGRSYLHHLDNPQPLLAVQYLRKSLAPDPDSPEPPLDFA